MNTLHFLTLSYITSHRSVWFDSAKTDNVTWRTLWRLCRWKNEQASAGLFYLPFINYTFYGHNNRWSVIIMWPRSHVRRTRGMKIMHRVDIVPIWTDAVRGARFDCCCRNGLRVWLRGYYTISVPSEWANVPVLRYSSS